MTPAPDGLCMVGQEMYAKQAEYWNTARANRDKPIGRHWEWLAETEHRTFLGHIDRCKSCRRTLIGNQRGL